MSTNRPEHEWEMTDSELELRTDGARKLTFSGVAVNEYLATKDPAVDYVISMPNGSRRTARCGPDDVIRLTPGEKVLSAVCDLGIRLQERAPPIIVDSPPYDR